MSNQAFGVAMAFGKALKDHPDLKELNKADDVAQSKMMKTMMVKDVLGSAHSSVPAIHHIAYRSFM